MKFAWTEDAIHANSVRWRATNCWSTQTSFPMSAKLNFRACKFIKKKTKGGERERKGKMITVFDSFDHRVRLKWSSRSTHLTIAFDSFDHRVRLDWTPRSIHFTTAFDLCNHHVRLKIKFIRRRTFAEWLWPCFWNCRELQCEFKYMRQISYDAWSLTGDRCQF